MGDNLRDRIWLTARIRMISEARLRSLSRTLSVLTVWYSTILTCLTVYQLTVPADSVRNVASAALAIAVLVLTVFVPSLNLDSDADRFRECYLKLQRLLDTVPDHEALNLAYHDILEAYPNHTNRNRTDCIAASHLDGAKLSTAGKEIQVSFSMWVSYGVRLVFRFLSPVVGFFLPFLVYFIL